ncbi:MAG: electron transfer flavoprotein subunit alpha/FixB family protein [Thaumarchaeota archaeon]|nr:electron transfer flavoprotein subunit alpha/FixB family protein [Nitrososphaerota archaeon]
MAGVLSYSEDAALAGELAAAGALVARSLSVDAIAVELDEVSKGARLTGKVVLAKGTRNLEDDAESAAAAIVEIAKGRGSRVVLIGATRFGAVVGGKVAARLRMGSLAGAKVLEVDGEKLVATREVYAGKFIARVAARLPCVATVQQGAYSPGDGTPASVETVNVAVENPKVSLLETRRVPRALVDIKSAAVIISAGRGFAKKEDLSMVVDLAKAMGGAVGCSRPLASDLGWLGEEQQIGLTGSHVHPRLYVAVGISGQLQHVAGIKDSRVIVAINKDKGAPIFQVADYGIVGDLYQVLPALIRALGEAP